MTDMSVPKLIESPYGIISSICILHRSKMTCVTERSLSSPKSRFETVNSRMTTLVSLNEPDVSNLITAFWILQ